MPIWLDTLFRAITAAAAIAAATVAIRGLRAWEEQLRGKTEYEHARRVLRAVLEARDQIGAVRNPFVSPGEMAEAFREAGIDPKDPDDERAHGLVYGLRWKPLGKAMMDLSAELLEAEVLWGKAIRTPERALHRCVAELNNAITMYFRDLRRPQRHSVTKEVAERQMERAERQFTLVYDQSSVDKPDEFASRVSAAIAAFEDILRPHLNLRH